VTERHAPGQRIPLLALEWNLPAHLKHADPAPFLALLRETLAEALPLRIGRGGERLPHKVAPGDYSEFLRFWRDVSAIEHGSFFSWKASPPIFGGHIRFPDSRNGSEHPPPRAVRLFLHVDGRVPEQQGTWAERAVELLTSVAQLTQAFFGAAYLQRNWVFRSGRLWYDTESEDAPTGQGTDWLGLPPDPTWLTWYGPSYAALVRSALEGFPCETRGASILVRLTAHPVSKDELRGLAPRLPAELLAVRADPRFPATSPTQLARVIPPVD
jgi:hypothetical protein